MTAIRSDTGETVSGYPVYDDYRSVWLIYPGEFEVLEDSLKIFDGIPQEVEYPLIKGVRELTESDFYLGNVAADWMDDSANWSYYLSCSGNMDEIFGTNVETDENDDYINVYAYVSPGYDEAGEHLEIALWKGNGDIEYFRYQLSETERLILLNLILEYEVRRMSKRYNHTVFEIERMRKIKGGA